MRKILFCFLFIWGCANEATKTRNVESYYQSSGIEKYFLSELPPWANFSTSGVCFRKEQIRYFDILALMKSYGIDYKTAIQIQATFNDEYLSLAKTKDSVIPFSEEQLLFFRASDKVNSKIVFFEAPTYKRIHLIWIDSVDEKIVKKFLKSNIHDKGIPVLVSLCLTKKEIEAKFSETNFKTITTEMLSIYDVSGAKLPGFNISLDQFFTQDQELILYTKEKNIQNINELKGKYKILNY
jgi:hypothetical protein